MTAGLGNRKKFAIARARSPAREARALPGVLLPPLGSEEPKGKTDNMKRAQIVLGVTVLTLGILSAVPGSRATEPAQVDANSNSVNEPLTLDIRAAAVLRLQAA